MVLVVEADLDVLAKATAVVVAGGLCISDGLVVFVKRENSIRAQLALGGIFDWIESPFMGVMMSLMTAL